MKFHVPLLIFSGFVLSQQIGTQAPENHPKIEYSTCTVSGGCTGKNGEVVIDANWRWLHSTQGTQNCYTGNSWDKNLCPDVETCSKNCAIDGADYSGTYGITSNGNKLRLNFVTHGSYGDNIGSRTYLMENESTYATFGLLNREFTFTADVSKLPCGLNGALYFVEMDADGGKEKYPNNKAGAKYGTGYCDAQCPHDLKFINGEANCEGWNPNPSDKNSGKGKYGTCCQEIDIWEANTISSQYTIHPCNTQNQGPFKCEGKDCGDNSSGDRYNGVCDKDGCDFNPYRLGAKNYFGPGEEFIVNSKKPFTVVTQFITTDGTDNGDLKEVRRLYVQDGIVHNSTVVNIGGNSYDSMTDEYCGNEKKAFNDTNDFSKKGGFQKLTEVLKRKSQVLVMSLWDDHDVNMLWLDSCYPKSADENAPGVCRGSCDRNSGKPEDVERNSGDAYVVYSDIRVGEIGSTYSGSPSPSPSPGPRPSPSGCPGGDLSACIGLCPSSPAVAFKACVDECVKRCS